MSLVALQLSGLHMHVSDHGYVGTPQGTHVHGAPPASEGAPVGGAGIAGSVAAHSDHPHPDGGSHESAGHDHDGERDVAVVELGAGATKLLAVAVWSLLILLLGFGSRDRGWALRTFSRPPARRIHWRPPLRAPPAFSHQ